MKKNFADVIKRFVGYLKPILITAVILTAYAQVWSIVYPENRAWYAALAIAITTFSGEIFNQFGGTHLKFGVKFLLPRWGLNRYSAMIAVVTFPFVPTNVFAAIAFGTALLILPRLSRQYMLKAIRNKK